MHTAHGPARRRDPIMIVGGGLAGQRCVETLRRSGDEGAIRMVCAETWPPYDRPPPSKQLLHWEAAGRQGMRAARSMLGLEPGPAPLTSFWTDQYGIRIQYLGRSRLADEVRIDSDPTQRSFTATFIRADRPVAALVVDRGGALPALRELIEKGAS
jgi:NADPH-dependent 2,4-dienoyl-CoA reductase/sulfur reductase-like enzyme